MTAAELSCYRVMRLMAAPKRFAYFSSIQNYRDADGVKFRRHLKGLREAGYIKIIDHDKIELLK